MLKIRRCAITSGRFDDKHGPREFHIFRVTVPNFTVPASMSAVEPSIRRLRTDKRTPAMFKSADLSA